MGMTREEVLVKLNMDASQLDEQTKRSFSQLANVGKEHHKWWQHAGSAGREFHKVLEKITESSPLAGEALRLAINPVVGMLSLAVLGFEQLKKKMDEAKEKAKEAALEFAEAMRLTGGSTDRARTVNSEVRDRERAQGYPVEPGVRERLRAIASENAAVAKTAHELDKKQKKLDEMQEAYDKAQDYLQKHPPSILGFDMYGRGRKEAQEIIDKYDDLRQKIAGVNSELERQKNKVSDLTQADKDQIEAVKEFEKIAQRNAEAAIAHAADVASRPEPSIGGPGDANVLGDRSGRNFVSGSLSDEQLRDPDLMGAIDASTGGYALRRILGKEGLAANGGIKYNPLSGSADWLRKNLQKPQAPAQTAEQLLGQVIDKLSNPLTVQGKD